MVFDQDIIDAYISLADKNTTLRDAHGILDSAGHEQKDIPLVIQLVENPKFDLPGINIFNGSSDLETHDYIHLILGRGLLPKDEAFVLGFTMGSTNRVNNFEEKLYGLFSRYIYPKPYRFSKSDFDVYKDAVRLGYISDCKPLHEVDYRVMLDWPLDKIRKEVGIEEDLISAYYSIEKKRYLDSFESQRLFTG